MDQPVGEKTWGPPLACGFLWEPPGSPGQDPEKPPAGSGGAGTVTVSHGGRAGPSPAEAPGPRPAAAPLPQTPRGQPGNAAAGTRLVRPRPTKGQRVTESPALLPCPHRALAVRHSQEDTGTPPSQGHKRGAGGIQSSGTYSFQTDTNPHTCTTDNAENTSGPRTDGQCGLRDGD